MEYRIISLEKGSFRAEICTLGGQLIHAWNEGQSRPLLWMGRKAEFTGGKAIRGGMPVCWPWFGAAPVEGRPPQGFARLCRWETDSVRKDFVRMRLPMENVPPEWIDFPFELVMEIRLSDGVEAVLSMTQFSPAAVRISAALHTYLTVSDCRRIEIHGLEGIPYTVKGGGEQPGETAPLQCRGECCRLYYPHSGMAEIADPGWNRRILIEKEGSRSTLVWNPGRERASKIPDMADGEYTGMVCVEANLAGADALELVPGKTHCLKQKLRILPL